MPDLSSHQSAHTTKLLLIGHSGAGKTGSLASLAAAGFNLRILDLDNGLDILYNLITSDPRYATAKTPGRVTYQTLTEPMKKMGEFLMPARTTVWPRLVRLLDKWQEFQLDADGNMVLGEDKKPILLSDLGGLSSWTDQDVLVVDSLTRLGSAAYTYDAFLNAKLGPVGQAGGYTQNEHRRAIGRAQGMIERLLETLYDKSIKANVIVISHIVLVDDKEAMASGQAGSGEDGENTRPKQGFPMTIGQALSPKVPQYFNNTLYIRATGSGSATRHKIYTKTQGVVNVKSSAPFKIKSEYPIETGLADYFRDLRA